MHDEEGFGPLPQLTGDIVQENSFDKGVVSQFPNLVVIFPKSRGQVCFALSRKSWTITITMCTLGAENS